MTRTEAIKLCAAFVIDSLAEDPGDFANWAEQRGVDVDELVSWADVVMTGAYDG